MIPFLLGLGFIYVVNSASVRTLLTLQNEQLPIIGNTWFMGFLGFEAWLSFIVAAWAGPGMVSKDFANQAVQLTDANQGSTLSTLSRNERDRLVQLTGGTPSGKPPASAQNPAPKN